MAVLTLDLVSELSKVRLWAVVSRTFLVRKMGRTALSNEFINILWGGGVAFRDQRRETLEQGGSIKPPDPFPRLGRKAYFRSLTNTHLMEEDPILFRYLFLSYL